jgi:putative FmdB family regulatory protein
MPIYEYRCGNCKRRVSLFFGSFSAAERRAEAGEIECPRCGSKELSRLMSKVNMVRDDRGATTYDDFDGADDPGMDGVGGMDGMFEGLDDEDPRSVARWARRMKESMGDELDMGPEFDQALARIEAGEDPDKVMDDVDPEALGGIGGDDEALDDFDESGE